MKHTIYRAVAPGSHKPEVILVQENKPKTVYDVVRSLFLSGFVGTVRDFRRIAEETLQRQVSEVSVARRIREYGELPATSVIRRRAHEGSPYLIYHEKERVFGTEAAKSKCLIRLDSLLSLLKKKGPKNPIDLFRYGIIHANAVFEYPSRPHLDRWALCRGLEKEARDALHVSSNSTVLAVYAPYFVPFDTIRRSIVDVSASWVPTTHENDPTFRGILCMTMSDDYRKESVR